MYLLRALALRSASSAHLSHLRASRHRSHRSALAYRGSGNGIEAATWRKRAARKQRRHQRRRKLAV